MLRFVCENGVSFEVSEGVTGKILSMKSPKPFHNLTDSLTEYGLRPLLIEEYTEEGSIGTWDTQIMCEKPELNLEPNGRYHYADIHTSLTNHPKNDSIEVDQDIE